MLLASASAQLVARLARRCSLLRQSAHTSALIGLKISLRKNPAPDAWTILPRTHTTNFSPLNFFVAAAAHAPMI
jgi:hypothetical protein